MCCCVEETQNCVRLTQKRFGQVILCQKAFGQMTFRQIDPLPYFLAHIVDSVRRLFVDFSFGQSTFR
jgi:hypothetical protein